MNLSNITLPAWLKGLGAALLAVVICAGINTYGERQFALGQQAERAVWLDRENTELASANARIIKLEENARATERAHAQSMAAASAQYQESLQHEKATKDRVIADLRAGALRLRFPAANTAGERADGDTTAALGPSAAGCDGGAGGELSLAVAEFFVGLASEADEVVHQLAACQAVVIADRQGQGEP
ncbi:MAG: lysis protein [Azonexus sp.]|jgi:hypothetical protein|nr:lysis protein [Azonexus sp.]